jgi:hypothetical protein
MMRFQFGPVTLYTGGWRVTAISVVHLDKCEMFLTHRRCDFFYGIASNGRLATHHCRGIDPSHHRSDADHRTGDAADDGSSGPAPSHLVIETSTLLTRPHQRGTLLVLGWIT